MKLKNVIDIINRLANDYCVKAIDAKNEYYTSNSFEEGSSAWYEYLRYDSLYRAMRDVLELLDEVDL